MSPNCSFPTALSFISQTECSFERRPEINTRLYFGIGARRVLTTNTVICYWQKSGLNVDERTGETGKSERDPHQTDTTEND